MNTLSRIASFTLDASAVALLAAACCAAATPVAAAESAAQVAAATPTGCVLLTPSQVEALFQRWNESLQTGDPLRVVANYAQDSLLLPTLSNTPRYSAAEKADYFRHFLQDGPVGTLGAHRVEVGCNTAVDAGLYTFNFSKTGASVAARYTFTYRWDGGQWLITSHHSSAMPQH